MLRCAEAEGTELTCGPGVSERGRATLRWGNGADGWARPVIRLARARAEGASGLSGVGARGGPGRVARGRPGSGLGRWRARAGRQWGSLGHGESGACGSRPARAGPGVWAPVWAARKVGRGLRKREEEGWAVAGFLGPGFLPFPSGLRWVWVRVRFSIFLSLFYFYFKQSLNSNQNLNSNHTQNN